MMTNNENIWGDQDNNQTQGSGSTSFGTPDTGDTTNNYSSDDIADEDDDLIDDDDDLVGDDDLDGGDDVLADDDDLLADDDDLEDGGYDETRLDDTEGGGTTSGSYTTGLGDSESTNPDEIPEERQSDDEGTGYTEQNEHPLQREGNDASFSEGTDVTPPDQHEFPSVGSPQTDFASRNQGRTTGRMVGHEPGTEGI
jgi:hypothetical protein